MNDLVIAFVLGIVEGLTEFIPVSSTGHLIIAGDLLGFEGGRAATFEVVIQLGAILAVAWLYRQRLFALCTWQRTDQFAGFNGLRLLAITTAPALILGAVTHGFIKDQLFNSVTVAIGLAAGGIALIVVERRSPPVRRTGIDELRWQDALLIGAFQCLALWPGVSRSAATIVGAMFGGIGRTTAAEYSFLAAIPLITAAALFELAQSVDTLTRRDLPIFIIGFVSAFIFARLAVAMFIRYLGTATLIPFGWYRICLALLVLAVVGAKAIVQ